MKTFGFYNDTAPPVQSEWNPFGFISTGGFSPAILQQFKLNNNFSGTITFDSPVTEGNLIVVAYMGTGNTLGPTISDSLANIYTLFNGQSVGISSAKLYGYYAYNCFGGTCTISLNGGATTNRVCFIAEYSGITNTENPLLDSDGNKGGNSPLQNALTFASDSLIFNAWFNPSTNDKTGLVGGTSYISNDIGGASKFNSQQHLTKALESLSPLNVGITDNTSVLNTIVSGAFKLGLNENLGYEPETTAYMTTANIQNDSTIYLPSTIWEKTGAEWWTALNNWVKRIKNIYGLTFGVSSLSNQFMFLYPRLGGTSTTCAINLVTGLNGGSFVGGWTIDGGGITPNGVNAYFQILNKYSSAEFSQDNQSFGNLLKTDLNNFDADYGSTGTGFANLIIRSRYLGNYLSQISDQTTGTIAVSNSLGLFSQNRISSTENKQYQNGVLLQTNAIASIPLPPPASAQYLVEAATINSGSVIQFSPRKRTIFYGGLGMTDTQMIQLNLACQLFETDLNR